MGASFQSLMQQPQAQSQPQQSQGFQLSDLLPMAGGTIGAIGGGILGNVPGAIGGGAAGSALGETLRELLSGQGVSGGQIAGQGALGALGGAGGEILGAGYPYCR